MKSLFGARLRACVPSTARLAFAGISLGLTGMSAIAAIFPGAPGANGLQRPPAPLMRLPVALSQASATSGATAQLGMNLAPIFNHAPGGLLYPSLSGPEVPGDTTWNGQGELPNAFQRPWSFADTNLDPSFRTTYWTEGEGFIDVAGAPWYLGGVSRRYGAQIYADGMKRLGGYDFSALTPVFADPSLVEATAAR